MPELPEVEAARKAVHECCCNRRIVEATVADDTLVIDSVAPSALENALVGRTILSAHRKGKNLWLELDARPWPSFQFGMTGAFSIKGQEITKYKRSAVSDKEEWPSKFSKVFFKLDDGLEVSFTDKRRLARVRLFDDPTTVPPISELGPDAFNELPAETMFVSSVLKKRCPIKALVMDQSFLAGIGNWVADEVLYQARIHPEQVASSLSETECISLHKAIQKVLKLSVDVNADSELFPKDWIFHYRWNKKPGEVGGEKISFITVNGRTSAVVPTLQKCTLQSSQKKSKATEAQDEENETESTPSDTKKKRARNVQNGKAAIPPDGQEIDDSHAGKRSKASTKKTQPAKKADSKDSGKSKKTSSKQFVEGEEDIVAVTKGKRRGRAREARNQKEKHLENLPKSGKKQGRDPAKVQSSKTELKGEERASKAVNAQNKVGSKTSTKRAKQGGDSEEREKGKPEKCGEISNVLRKEEGRKRKRVVK